MVQLIAIRLIIYLFLYFVFSELIDRPAFPKLGAFIKLFRNDYLSDLLRNSLPTLERWAVVLILGSLLGVFFGVLAGYSAKAYAISNFDIDFFRSIPATTIVTFVFVAFGDNEISRNIPAFYITFFTVVFYVSKHIHIIDKTRIHHLEELGAKSAFILKNCLYYEAIPTILIAIRQAISLSFLVLISIELLFGTSNNLGLGVILWTYKERLKYKEILFTILYIGMAGYAANYAFKLVNKRLIYWKKKMEI
jgi:ABC-type nitrate/sulfonate/bicarbonate transport system permease component